MDEQMIEAMGMRLANRAYLYRLFHIAFGAEPSKEMLAALCSRESVEALRYFGSTDEAAHMREDGTGRSLAEVLDSIADALAECAGKEEDPDYVESMKSAFTRLFLVPGSSYVYVWESPYIGKETMLFQESTLDVRRRYAEYGFTAVEFGHFPEDHLSMMLDFLAHLSSTAYDVFGDGGDEELFRILSSQQEFVSEHIVNWLPAFRERLDEKDVSGMYSDLAEALYTFLQVDSSFMGHVLAMPLVDQA